MMDNLMQCAHGGAWLMGGIVFLILLLLFACVVTLLVRGGPFRQEHHGPRREQP